MDTIEALKIIVPGAASIAVAWIGGRAAGRTAGAKEQEALAARVAALEANEPADLAAARKDAGQALAIATTAGTEAAQAKTLAQGAKDDLVRHIADEKERRDTARTYAQERAQTIAAMVDKLTDKLTENTTSLKVLEARFNSAQDAGGVSRRGR